MPTHHTTATALLLTPLLAMLISATPVGADVAPTGAAVSAQMVEGPDTLQWGYSPQAASLSAGQSLAWTNQGAAPHTATEDSGSWDTGVLLPGATAAVNFAAPGTYAYHCTLHPWMKGSVVVTADDAAPADVVPADVTGQEGPNSL
jgi:plastocyanin